jgi:hypothetical protein
MPVGRFVRKGNRGGSSVLAVCEALAGLKMFLDIS